MKIIKGFYKDGVFEATITKEINKELRQLQTILIVDNLSKRAYEFTIEDVETTKDTFIVKGHDNHFGIKIPKSVFTENNKVIRLNDFIERKDFNHDHTKVEIKGNITKKDLNFQIYCVYQYSDIVSLPKYFNVYFNTGFTNKFYLIFESEFDLYEGLKQLSLEHEIELTKTVTEITVQKRIEKIIKNEIIK